MNTNLLSVVKHITAHYGEAVLDDAKRLKAFFADLAKDEPRPLRLAFCHCIETGAYNALKTAPDAAERDLRKTALAQRLRDEHGLDPALCAEALDILEAALFGDTQTPPKTPPRSAAGEPEGISYWKGWFPYSESTQEHEARQPRSAPPATPAPPVMHEAPAKPRRKRAPTKWNATPQPPPAEKKHTLRNVLIAAAVMISGAVLYQWYQQNEYAAEAVRAETARVEALRAVNMIRVEGGIFMMGSPANEAEREPDEVRHQVTVSTFYMGKYEVTQKEWREVMGNNPSDFKGDNLPVEQVTWHDAVAYCNKRSQREGMTPAYTINGTNVSWNRNANGYRLPTEAEWEYACRAGTSGPFSTGTNISASQANYNGNYPYANNAKGTYRARTVNIDSFAPNAWGLYNMHGNVWEWCWDWYRDYASGAQTDPAGPSSGDIRVFRGGSWYIEARSLRSAFRGARAPSIRYGSLGFRLARSQ
jgi:formylglycine-generating enzyme required for sulfatase activity